MSAEHLIVTLLEALKGRVLARLPTDAGITAGDVEDWYGRRFGALYELVAQHVAPGSTELLARIMEEHRLALRLLEAAETYLRVGGPAVWGQDLADFLEGLREHARFEEETAWPFLVARLPLLANTIAHATQEHRELEEQETSLGELLAALRAGTPLRIPYPAFAPWSRFRHHFLDEDFRIYRPARIAGVAQGQHVPLGSLILLAPSIDALADEIAEAAAQARTPGVVVDHHSIVVEGHSWSPADVWSEVERLSNEVLNAFIGHERARGKARTRWVEKANAAHAARRTAFARFYRWRERYPDVPVPGLNRALYRLLELLGDPNPHAFSRFEIDRLGHHFPEFNWPWKPGDQVRVHRLVGADPGLGRADRHAISRGWRVAAVGEVTVELVRWPGETIGPAPISWTVERL